MRDVRFKLFSAMAVSASLVLATAAWSTPRPAAAYPAVRGGNVPPRPMKGQKHDLLGWIAGWWNDGSCHGYPDVMNMYVLYGDPDTGDITDWEPNGQTDGHDSCSDWHDPTWNTSYPMWDGYVQGNPTGTTSWTPDDGICDGCLKLSSAVDMLHGVNEIFLNASLTPTTLRVAPWRRMPLRTAPSNSGVTLAAQ
jgi:hypothetical protein